VVLEPAVSPPLQAAGGAEPESATPQQAALVGAEVSEDAAASAGAADVQVASEAPRVVLVAPQGDVAALLQEGGAVVLRAASVVAQVGVAILTVAYVPLRVGLGGGLLRWRGARVASVMLDAGAVAGAVA